MRQTLGLNFPVTDYEIEDSLYYYYYDVPKTVNYLLSASILPPLWPLSLTETDQKTKTQAKKPKKDQVDQVVKSSTGKPDFSLFLAFYRKG